MDGLPSPPDHQDSPSISHSDTSLWALATARVSGAPKSTKQWMSEARHMQWPITNCVHKGFQWNLHVEPASRILQRGVEGRIVLIRRCLQSQEQNGWNLREFFLSAVASYQHHLSTSKVYKHSKIWTIDDKSDPVRGLKQTQQHAPFSPFYLQYVQGNSWMSHSIPQLNYLFWSMGWFSLIGNNQ